MALLKEKNAVHRAADDRRSSLERIRNKIAPSVDESKRINHAALPALARSLNEYFRLREQTVPAAERAAICVQARRNLRETVGLVGGEFKKARWTGAMGAGLYINRTTVMTILFSLVVPLSVALNLTLSQKAALAAFVFFLSPFFNVRIFTGLALTLAEYFRDKGRYPQLPPEIVKAKPLADAVDNLNQSVNRLRESVRNRHVASIDAELASSKNAASDLERSRHKLFERYVPSLQGIARAGKVATNGVLLAIEFQHWQEAAIYGLSFAIFWAALHTLLAAIDEPRMVSFRETLIAKHGLHHILDDRAAAALLDSDGRLKTPGSVRPEDISVEKVANLYTNEGRVLKKFVESNYQSVRESFLNRLEKLAVCSDAKFQQRYNQTKQRLQTLENDYVIFSGGLDPSNRHAWDQLSANGHMEGWLISRSRLIGRDALRRTTDFNIWGTELAHQAGHYFHCLVFGYFGAVMLPYAAEVLKQGQAHASPVFTATVISLTVLLGLVGVLVYPATSNKRFELRAKRMEQTECDDRKFQSATGLKVASIGIEEALVARRRKREWDSANTPKRSRRKFFIVNSMALKVSVAGITELNGFIRASAAERECIRQERIARSFQSLSSDNRIIKKIVDDVYRVGDGESNRETDPDKTIRMLDHANSERV